MEAIQIVRKLQSYRCEFCHKVATGDSARSYINRHIKRAAAKQANKRNKDDPHPPKDSEQYKKIEKQWRFHSQTKDADEKAARRSEVQRRSVEKRMRTDLPKVDKAFERLKYMTIFLSVIN